MASNTRGKWVQGTLESSDAFHISHRDSCKMRKLGKRRTFHRKYYIFYGNLLIWKNKMLVKRDRITSRWHRSRSYMCMRSRRQHLKEISNPMQTYTILINIIIYKGCKSWSRNLALELIAYCRIIHSDGIVPSRGNTGRLANARNFRQTIYM